MEDKRRCYSVENDPELLTAEILFRTIPNNNIYKLNDGKFTLQIN